MQIGLMIGLQGLGALPGNDEKSKGIVMKPATDEMKKRVNEMSADEWFSLSDIVSEHNPGLWQHLCYMDDGQHKRSDGCLFVANQTRTKFVWQSQSAER